MKKKSHCLKKDIEERLVYLFRAIEVNAKEVEHTLSGLTDSFDNASAHRTDEKYRLTFDERCTRCLLGKFIEAYNEVLAEKAAVEGDSPRLTRDKKWYFSSNSC